MWQVLFSTSVFSRLWATRMEQQQLSLYRKVRLPFHSWTLLHSTMLTADHVRFPGLC
jgi:hypothetical protein